MRADTPDDVWLYNNAGLEYADIDDHDTALTWLTQGLQLAMATGDPEDLVDQLADLRARLPGRAGPPGDDELQQQAAAFVAPATPAPADTDRPALPAGARGPATRRPALFRRSPASEWPVDPWAGPGAAAPFPADPPATPSAAGAAGGAGVGVVPRRPDYQQALARWPELTTEGAAKGAKDHADYNRALQRTLQDYADAGALPAVHRADPDPAVPGLVRTSRTGTRPTPAPATPPTLARRGDPSLIAWPPARNQRCWCGSGRKYKQCCGSVRAMTDPTGVRHRRRRRSTPR